jgi:hypothetical protein
VLSKKLKVKIYSTIILSVVLYGCETWPLTLREKRRLRVVENRLLRRILGPKRNEVTVEWRKQNNEKLSDLYSSQNIIWVIKSRRMLWAGHVTHMAEKGGACKVLVGKSEGKSTHGRSRRRWEDNIKMYLQEVDCEGIDRLDLAQDRDRWRILVNAVMNFRFP